MRAARIDDNQKAIVAALRKIGCQVLHLHTVGQGCTDILCKLGNTLLLMEIKDGDKPPSAQKLTPQQEVFHKEWRGSVVVVNSIEAALEAITRQV